MKKVSASLDDELLRQLDDYAEAHDRGRSAVLREAVIAYLARVASPPPENGDSPDLEAVASQPGERTLELPGTGKGARLSNEEVVRRYKDGYREFPPTEDELNGWEDEEAWPEE